MSTDKVVCDVTAETLPELIVGLLAGITEAERDEVFSALRDSFCLECGSDDPSCQCWNDE
jgi:hypothetical protein